MTIDSAASTAPAARPEDASPAPPLLERAILGRALALGVLADVILRPAGDGLGWSLWVLILALTAAGVARRRQGALGAEPQAWLFVAVLCAAAFSWRDADALRPLNVLGTLVAIAMFAMTTDGRPATSIMAARIRDVITGGLYTVLDLLAGAPFLVASEAKLQALPPFRGGRSWTVLRAALLTIPLVLVFGALLSNADPAFAALFDFSLDLERIIPHVVVTGVFTWLVAGWLRGALLRMADRPTLPDRLPLQLGMTEITASLGAVAALFAVFVILQLRWLFGGASVVLATSGLTLADYARRGFFELVAVAALVLPLILVTGALLDDHRVVRRHRVLSLALLALLGAIMGSALTRLQLYVDSFGLSSDRLYAAMLMGWLGIVGLAMAGTILRGRPRLFAAIAVLSGFATLGTLNAVNPDRLVARVNLSRPPVTREIDYAYLARLGGDAAPALAAALRNTAPSAAACEGAQVLRTRWLGRTETLWNLNARRGRTAVAEQVTEAELDRLCRGAPASPVLPAR